MTCCGEITKASAISVLVTAARSIGSAVLTMMDFEAMP
jgi:hypothetical protein